MISLIDSVITIEWYCVIVGVYYEVYSQKDAETTLKHTINTNKENRTRLEIKHSVTST